MAQIYISNKYVTLFNLLPSPSTSPPHPISKLRIPAPVALWIDPSFDAAFKQTITMDGDPAVEPELDSFSLTLPLPYRVALVVVLGTFSSWILDRGLYTDHIKAFGHGAQICIISHLLKSFVSPLPLYTVQPTNHPRTYPPSCNTPHDPPPEPTPHTTSQPTASQPSSPSLFPSPFSSSGPSLTATQR